MKSGKLAVIRAHPGLLLPVVGALLIFFLAFARPVLQPFISSLAEGRVPVEQIRITHGGADRSYWLHRPSGLGGQAPLLMVLHGVGQSPRGVARLTGFSQIADRERFLVAYPEGIGHRWNDGANVFESDDVGFLSAVIEHVAKNHQIDRSRVFMTGVSAGGMMSYRFACEGGGAAVAVATVVGNLPERVAAKCTSASPTSVLAVAGRDDRVIYYEGETGRHLSAEASAEHWARLDGCQESRTSPPDGKPPSWAASRASHSQCHAATGVSLMSFNGGHDWPTARGALLGFRSGGPNPLSEEIWRFFAAHPRPS
ncbi:MAG: alpha/beta hydrolase family esterase [Acidimicrobiia bacterium]